jgi:hypothetical protein
MGEVVATGNAGQFPHQGDGRCGVEDDEEVVFRSLCGPSQDLEVKVVADHRSQ